MALVLRATIAVHLAHAMRTSIFGSLNYKVLTVMDGGATPLDFIVPGACDLIILLSVFIR